MDMKGSRPVLLSLLCLLFLASCNARHEEGISGLPAAGPNDRFRIGVCMPPKGGLAELSKLQARGIRAAGDMVRDRAGRNVELIFRETGESPRAFSDTIQKVLMDDRVSGIITCASDDEVDAARSVLARTPVPFLVTSPCTNTFRTGGEPPEIRMCTALGDQAYACARFLSHELKARRIGIIIDADDPVAVKIASLFSSELTGMPGRIVDIAFLQEGKDLAASIRHLMDAGPDAVYLPFAGGHSRALVEMVRSGDPDRPVLVGTLQAEETMLGEAVKVLDGVYVRTEFIGETVKSSQGMEFIEYYRRHAGRKVYLGSGIATGAEGLFLMIDMISEARQSKLVGDAPRAAASRRGSLLGFTGVTPSGAVYQHLVFGKIEKKFLGRPAVTFVAAVPLKRSDPVADAGTQ